MMGANLFQQYLQPARSVMDYMGDMDAQDLRRAQLEGAQRQNALTALVANQTQREMAYTDQGRNAIRSAYAANAGATPDMLAKALEQTGHQAAIERADALRKSLLDRSKTTADIGKTTAETDEKKRETAEKKRKEAIQWVMSQSDPAIAEEAINQGVRDGGIGMAAGSLMLKALPKDPAAFRSWQVRMAAGLAEPGKMAALLKPLIQTNNTGGNTTTQAIDQTSGQVISTSNVRNTQSPDNAATVGASYANAAALRDQANATRDAARITARAGDETKVREEFAGLPEVKKFKNAIPAYQAIVRAAKINNPQADINLIYGLAKLYDPDSVVREGEYDTIANSQSIPEWLKGQAQRLAGGGKLTKETKAQIVEQANIRIESYKNEVDGARKSYGQILTGRGLDPKNVFPAIGEQLVTPGKEVNFGDLK
jgi:hypothetical protein